MSPSSSFTPANSASIIFTENSSNLPVYGMGSMVLPSSPSFRTAVKFSDFVQRYSLQFSLSLLGVPVSFTGLGTRSATGSLKLLYER